MMRVKQAWKIEMKIILIKNNRIVVLNLGLLTRVMQIWQLKAGTANNVI